MAKRKRSSNWSLTMTTLGIVALVGFALWFMHSLWALLGLLILTLFYTKQSSIKIQCPKCNHKFVVMAKDDDEDEDR